MTQSNVQHKPVVPASEVLVADVAVTSHLPGAYIFIYTAEFVRAFTVGWRSHGTIVANPGGDTPSRDRLGLSW